MTLCIEASPARAKPHQSTLCIDARAETRLESLVQVLRPVAIPM